jgi:hypothetical protein
MGDIIGDEMDGWTAAAPAGNEPAIVVGLYESVAGVPGWKTRRGVWGRQSQGESVGEGR